MQHGFNMKTVNAKDQTPLHLAAGFSGAVCKLLLAKGANVHADDKVLNRMQNGFVLKSFKKKKDGNLPIHYAARNNNGEAIEALVKVEC